MAASNFEKFKSDGTLLGNVTEWVDARFPLTAMWKGHLSEAITASRCLLNLRPRNRY